MSRNCPVCNSPQARNLRDIRYALPDDSPLPRTTVLKCCDACGFAFADSEARAEDYLQHYRVNSIYAAVEIRAGGGLNESDRARLAKAAARIASRLKPGDLFVDIGAGGGGLLRAVQQKSACRVLGIDPDPRCVQALQAAGFDALEGTLDRLPAKVRGQARVIALSHVLEHLWQPARDLQSALRLLAPGGCIYAETPDASRYADYPNTPFYYFDPEHINHFSVSGLNRLALETGCACVETGEDEIVLPDGTRYPVCWALLAGGVGMVQTEAAKQAENPGIERYVEQQFARAASWREQVQAQLAAFSGPFVVWGAGSHSQRVLADDLIDIRRVVAFADSDRSKQGRTLLGKPILAPAEALRQHASLPIVILAARSATAAISELLKREWPGRIAVPLAGG